MSFNPGEPVAGSTAPLWTLLLAAWYLVTPNIVVGAKVVSLALYLFCCILTFKIIVLILGDDRFAFLGAILTAMLSALMWGALSGMEVILAAFLTLSGIYLHIRYRTAPGKKRYAETVVFALAALARPEAMQLPFLAILSDFLLMRAEKKRTLGELCTEALRHLLLFFAILSPYFIFNIVTCGRFFPNTFAAKVGSGLFAAVAQRDPEELWRALSLYPRVYLSAFLGLASRHSLLLYWLMFVGAAGIVARSFKADTKNRALIIPVVFLLYPVSVGIVAPRTDAVRWMFRYLGHLLPLYVAMGVVGLHDAIGYVEGILKHLWAAEKTARTVARGLVIAVVPMLLLSLAVEEYENSKFYAQGVENINSMHVKIGRWMRENSPPDATLAANDIGAIAYFSERRVVDLVGLVTPDVLPYRGQPNGIYNFIVSKKPQYVIIFQKWFPDLDGRKELVHLFDVRLEHNAVCGDDKMSVYKTVWPE